MLGNIPPYGIFGDTDEAWVDETRLLSEAWEKALTMVRKLRPSADDTLILERTQEDIDKGFAEPVLSWRTFKDKHPPGSFRLIQRFVVTQSSGKRRVCDDGYAGGHTELTTECNYLQLCNALQPARHIQCLEDALRMRQESLAHGDLYAIDSGGEDWPDACRFTPVDPAQRLLCVVLFFHPVWRDQQCVFTMACCLD